MLFDHLQCKLVTIFVIFRVYRYALPRPVNFTKIKSLCKKNNISNKCTFKNLVKDGFRCLVKSLKTEMLTETRLNNAT